MPHISSNQRGFTIVEILVVLMVLGILIPLVMGTLFDFYLSNSATLVKTIQSGDNQSALRTIERDAVSAAEFLKTNAVPDPAAATAWNYAGTSGTRVLILSAYATTALATADTSGTRTLVYANGSCATPLKNNIVYFVNGGTLFRRTIKNTAATCGGSIAQKQSCAVGTTVAACAASDAVLLRDVTSFEINYYDNSTASVPYTAQYTTGADLIPITTAVVSIKTKRNASGTSSEITNSLRIVRQNS